NVALRMLEPLGAIEEAEDANERETPNHGRDDERGSQASVRGVAVRLADVSVLAAGHTILDGVDLSVAPGEHVAIVGPSGAGKSTLVGLLLGWHRAAAGRVEVDGALLRGARLDQLRREAAWVDPACQIWNRALLDNLLYGSSTGAEGHLGEVVAEA